MSIVLGKLSLKCFPQSVKSLYPDMEDKSFSHVNIVEGIVIYSNLIIQKN